MGSTWHYDVDRSLRTGTGQEFYRTPDGTLVAKAYKHSTPEWKTYSGPVPIPSATSTYRRSFTTTPKNRYNKPVTPYHPDTNLRTKACKPQTLSIQTNESNLTFHDSPPHLKKKPKHHFKTTYSSTYSPVKVPTHFHSNTQVLAQTTTFIRKQQEK